MVAPLLFTDLFAAESIFHGVFSRHGGKSTPPFASRNVSFGVGDFMEAVTANRALVKKHLDANILVSGHQVHGSAIHIVRHKPDQDREIADCDAFISDVPGVGLMIQQADCQAVMLHDPRKKIVANIHNGWRGSAANIIHATISEMKNIFSCNPADLLAAISPSLGPCCAEFINFKHELPPEFYAFQPKPFHFDFWEISRSQLMETGVRQENIRSASLCTVCDSDWFSYRREKQTGRFCSVIGLKG